MTYSCSATMTLYITAQCMCRIETWYRWNQHWIYGTSTAIKLPDAIPPDRPVVNGMHQLRRYGDSRGGRQSDFHSDYGYVELFRPRTSHVDDENGGDLSFHPESAADEDLPPIVDFAEFPSDASEISSDAEPSVGEQCVQPLLLFCGFYIPPAH